jgi:Uma2 family endonuclease
MNHPVWSAEPAEPRPYRWTIEEYYHLCEAEWFQGRHVQLIDGEIIDMPSQKNLHALAIKLTDTALSASFGFQFWVRVQMSLDLKPYSVPDPDLAVIPGSPRSHTTSSNPTTALLIVEVSETTLSYDRNAKASLYAAAGILDYWIVNLVQRQLEVFRDPLPDSTKLFGYGFASRTILDPIDVVTALALPASRILVADLLP